MKKWDEQFELEYWRRYDDNFYIDYLDEKHKHFNFDIHNKIIDIGGGRFGGSLYRYQHGVERFLLDPLADEFKEFGSLPENIKVIKGSVLDIPFEKEYFDAVVVWEVLDHLTTINELREAQREIRRVLKIGGVLYFNQPIRIYSTSGHTLLVSEEELLNFNLDLLEKHNKPFYDNGIEIYAKFKRTS